MRRLFLPLFLLFVFGACEDATLPDLKELRVQAEEVHPAADQVFLDVRDIWSQWTTHTLGTPDSGGRTPVLSLMLPRKNHYDLVVRAYRGGVLLCRGEHPHILLTTWPEGAIVPLACLPEEEGPVGDPPGEDPPVEDPPGEDPPGEDPADGAPGGETDNGGGDDDGGEENDPPPACRKVPLVHLSGKGGSTIPPGSRYVDLAVMNLPQYSPAFPHIGAKPWDVRAGADWATGTPAREISLADFDKDSHPDLKIRWRVSDLANAGLLQAGDNLLKVWGRDSRDGTMYCGEITLRK